MTTYVVLRRRRIAAVVGLSMVAAVAGASLGRTGSGVASVRSAAERVLPIGHASAALGAQDGYLGGGASLPVSSRQPAVARLDPALLAAVRRAAADAQAAGIELRINSGWRSTRYQENLERQAIATYGSVAVARQYVKPASQSRHVAGAAVDIGPAAAASWLDATAGAYGLCRIYANEAWHFELATEPGGPCPALVADAAG